MFGLKLNGNSPSFCQETDGKNSPILLKQGGTFGLILNGEIVIAFAWKQTVKNSPILLKQVMFGLNSTVITLAFALEEMVVRDRRLV